MSERAFRQEYLAEFISDGPSVFRGVAGQATAALLDKPIKGRTYVGGGDWGRTEDESSPATA
jgi:hypothetical protein